MDSLTNQQINTLKSMAQRLEAMLKVGKAGLSDGFIKTVDEALSLHELVKVKFADFKDEKKILSPLLAEKTQSFLVMRVGNVVVLYRRQPDETKRKIRI